MNEKNPFVFVVDDDASIRDSLRDLISSAGLDVETFASAQEFLTSQRPDGPACLVLDVQLPGLSGLDLQQELAKVDVQIPIIFITGHGDIPTTFRAMKAGAIEFLTKPFRDEDLLNAVEQAIKRSREIEQLNNHPAEAKPYFEDDLRSQVSFSESVGQSAPLRRVLKDVETVAPTDSTVLIHGETGTGKELIARAIHNLSFRRSNPFVKLNCSAIPTGLLEGELFGHEKGAFTGAIAQRTESAKAKSDVPLEASILDGAVPLESILRTEELYRRPSRPPDYGKENRALVALSSALADSPRSILQTLAEKVLEIVQADSAGLSLLTKDEKRFYWAAIAGAWSPHIGGGTPRNSGPCGDVLDRNIPMLFTHWERRYPYLRPATPLAEEGLLVPFYVNGKAVGTIWAIAHTNHRKFDAEDLRLLESLGRFASPAYQALVSIDDLKFQVAAREKAETAVLKLATGLEAKVRRLVEANIIGIVIWNVEGRIMEANEAFLRMVGYGRDDLVSGGMSWRDLTPDSWRAADDKVLAELAATGVCEPFEKEYFRKDGSRVPVLLGAALLEGRRDEGVAFVLDLSEQKRAEHALRESETRLQAFFENSPSLIFLKDLPGQYLYVNQEFKRAFRITQEQAEGKRDDELFSAEQAAIFQANDRQVLDAGLPIEFEEVTLQEDGLHTSIVHKFPLFTAEGEIYAIGGIATDITQRKRAESARRDSEERHRVIVETASDAVINADESGTILLANPATTRVFGYDPTELIGKPLTILMPEYMREKHEFGFTGYLATGQRHINWQGTELIGLRKNGEEFPVEVSFGEVARSGHRTFTGFIRDISEKKRARADLERAFSEIKLLKDQLYRENLALREEVDRASMFEEIVGTSTALQAVLDRAAKVAPTDSTVLITGETGTGKELIARAVHKRSHRAGRAFVSVNCAALPPSLISSELFGHEKGAFTGATQRRLGRFELADGGTIFLDEVGELPPDIQIALLRVLQERQFERVGGAQPITADVRVIAATNRDLKAATSSGTVRLDLFYRLNVFPIEVPPLRERKDDILMLLEYFVQRFASRAGKNFRTIDKKTLELLQSYEWPGNIRELQNVVERSVILSSGDVFSVDESWLSKESQQPGPRIDVSRPVEKESREEREIIEAALAECRGRVAGPQGAAAKLRIPASTLYSRIKALNIRKSDFKFG